MKKNRSILKNKGFQSLAASVLCILLGLLVGYVVLLIINPAGAGKAIATILKNFMYYPTAVKQMQYFGSTLVKTAPLLMCALSVLFANKAGLFNIGAAGQYVAGACMGLYAGLAWNLPWPVCLVFSVLAGAALGGVSGALKAYCNVNEVISSIMLNWIMLYIANIMLSKVKEPTSPYTLNLAGTNPGAVLPTLGLDKLLGGNQYVGIALPLAVLVAILVWVVLEKTKFGYELKATGYNKSAAKYCGMKEKRNIILTMAIAGGLAGLGAGLYYLTGFEPWETSASSIPAMGFNGIAAAYLGGLNPVGTIFASYFIQHITSGGAYVDKAMYSAQISDLISSLIIYLCGFVLFIKSFMDRLASRKQESNVNAEEPEKPASPAANEKGGKA